MKKSLVVLICAVALSLLLTVSANAAVPVTTRTITLNALDQASVTDPVWVGLYETEDLVLTVVATNETSISWEKDGNPLANGGNISGADTDTLTITGALATDSGSYTCVVDNALFLPVTSNPAVVNVYPQPTMTIVTVPADGGGDPGLLLMVTGLTSDPTFTVTVVPDAPVSTPTLVVYEWTYEGTPVVSNAHTTIIDNGVIGSTLTINDLVTLDSGDYTCVATCTAPL